ncbi:MAG TPA: tetratricopeptide repeat protein, partial [Halothiobacillus sp.]|nr:tetratricopeptide repeat protein [Halothiobacillus sp.]
GRYEEALEQLDRAYRMSSGYAEIGAHLGEVLWTLNQRERAREIWLESLEADPDHAVLRETLRRLAPELLP